MTAPTPHTYGRAAHLREIDALAEWLRGLSTPEYLAFGNTLAGWVEVLELPYPDPDNLTAILKVLGESS